jgi:hypothetical protein
LRRQYYSQWRSDVEAELGKRRYGSIAPSSMERPDGRKLCYGPRPHGSIAARRQAWTTYHPLTPPSRRMSVMVASFCIACPPAKYCRAVGRCTASVDLRASATDPVPFMRAVEIRPTLQAAPHRLLTALIVKLKRTVNVVLVSHSALALALKAATSSLPIRYRHRTRVADK